MAMPSVTKTYQYVTGFYGNGSAVLNDGRELWFGIKNSLIGFGGSPWTVSGSSNSVAAGIDAVDRWATVANLVWANAGSVHSWIVLRQSAILSTFEICIDLIPASNGGYQASIIVAPNAFTGGSTTARPTATNERTLLTGPFLQSSTSFPNGLFMQQSTDGYVTRFGIISPSGYMSTYVSLEVPTNIVSGWTFPWIAMAYNTATTSNAYTAAGLIASARYVGRVGTTDFTIFLGGEGYAGTLLHKSGVQNSFTQNYAIMPISLFSETTGARGRIGELQDVWWVTSPASGDVTQISLWPDGTSRTHIQIGEMLFPWNGTLPNLFPG